MTSEFPALVLWWVAIGPPALSIGAAVFSTVLVRKASRELHQRALDEERGREARATAEERGREERAAVAERMMSFRYLHEHAMSVAATLEEKQALLDLYARFMTGAVDDPVEVLKQLTAQPLAQAKASDAVEDVDFVVDPARESGRGRPTDPGDPRTGGRGPDAGAAG